MRVANRPRSMNILGSVKVAMGMPHAALLRYCVRRLWVAWARGERVVRLSPRALALCVLICIH